MAVKIFFFNDTATTEIYTLSLHDALPISGRENNYRVRRRYRMGLISKLLGHASDLTPEQARKELDGILRSEEHTSELQSRQYLVCRLLLEKKNSLIPSFSLASSSSFCLPS